MLADLDSTHKLWRGMMFREKIANIKVCNVGKLLADVNLWGTDPVHPTQDGYHLVANYLRKGLCEMMEKCSSTAVSTTGIGGGGGDSGASGEKRTLEDEDALLQGAPKRPFWATRNEDFVARDDGWRGGRNEGRGGGRGRGRGRGRGWFWK
jgi:hypothetical protein